MVPPPLRRKSSGGDTVRIFGSAASRRCGRAARVTAKVPRAFTDIIRSNRRSSVADVPVNWIALALLTTTSMPPKVSAHRATAWPTASRVANVADQPEGRRPPAASTSAAAV